MKTKITIHDFSNYELYKLAAQIYYLYYIGNELDWFLQNVDSCIENIKDLFFENNIDIRDLNQVDQFFAAECDVKTMNETMFIVDPSTSYQYEINWLIHNEQKRLTRWINKS